MYGDSSGTGFSSCFWPPESYAEREPEGCSLKRTIRDRPVFVKGGRAVKPEKKQATKSVHVRFSPEEHAELLEISHALGDLDLSTLCSLMVNESRPRFLKRARNLAGQYRTAREAFNEATTGADNPKVAHLVLVGRHASPEDRVRKLAKAARVLWAPGDPPLESLVEAAEKLLRDEDLRRQVEQAVEETNEEAVRE
jgi:hypothetical protein